MNIKESVQEAVAVIRKRIGELVPNYAGDFTPLFRMLASWFGGAYDDIQRELKAAIEPLRDRVAHAMKTSATEAQASYRRTHEEALDKLRAGIRNAMAEHAAKEAQKGQRVQELTDEEIALERRVRAQNVSLSGTEDHLHISAKPSKYQAVFEVLLVVAAILAVMGIEWLAGYGMWQWAADPNIALGLTLITVFGFTLLVRITVVYLRRYLAHRDALRNFKRRYPNGHREGFNLYPFPQSEKKIAFAGLGLFTVGALLLLGSRLWIAFAQNDFGGLAASVGLLFILLVYGMMEFAITPLYSKQQMNQVRTLRKQLDDVQLKLVQLHAPVPPEKHPYRVAVLDLFRRYNEVMDAEEGRIAGDVEKLEADRQSLVRMVSGFGEARDRLQRTYVDFANELIVSVTREWALDGASLPFGTETEDATVRAHFQRAVNLNLQNPEFFDGLRDYRFEVNLPDNLRVCDLNQVMQEIRRRTAVRLVAGGEAHPAGAGGGER